MEKKNLLILKEFLDSFSKQSKCKKDEVYNKSKSKSNLVFISKKKVRKIVKLNKYLITSYDHVIEIESTVMNILFQSLLKSISNSLKLSNENNELVEMYDIICENENNDIVLESNKYFFELPDNNFVSTVEEFFLSDYFKKSDDNERIVNFLWNIIKQLFNVLDILFESIQFHHVDPKAAQLFLNGKLINEDIHLILGDFDKVTFTLNIFDTSYRIRLSKRSSIQLLKGTVQEIASKTNILSHIDQMRFLNYPCTDNNLEKSVFISSILLLSVKRIDVYNELLKLIEKNYPIIYKCLSNEFKNNSQKLIRLNNATSHSLAANYVNYKYTLNKNLKSNYTMKRNVSFSFVETTEKDV